MGRKRRDARRVSFAQLVGRWVAKKVHDGVLIARPQCRHPHQVLTPPSSSYKHQKVSGNSSWSESKPTLPSPE